MLQRGRWVLALEVALCCLGLASTLYLLFCSGPVQLSVGLLGSALFILSERIEVDMRSAVVTPTPVFTMAAAFVYGPGWAALWASIGALGAELSASGRRRPMTIALNSTLPGFYALLGVVAYHLAGGPMTHFLDRSTQFLAPGLLFMLFYLASNLIVVLFLYALRNPVRSARLIWEAARMDMIMWLVMVPTVYATLLLYDKLGPFGISFVLLPVMTFAWSMKLLWQLQRENRINSFFANSSSQFDAVRLAETAAELAIDVLSIPAAALAVRGEAGRWQLIGPEGRLAEVDARVLVASSLLEQATRQEILSPLLEGLSVQVVPVRPMGIAHEPVAYLVLGKGTAVISSPMVQRIASQLALAMERITEFQHTEAAAHSDSLTGLLNHQAFLQLFSQMIASNRGADTPVSLLLIDADHFKRINDTYGHPAGDLVICRLAAILQANCPSHGAVARMGGEEFALCAPIATEAARELAETIRSTFNDIVVEHDHMLIRNLSVSIGVASYPEHAITVSDLLARADQALYWGAKEVGRNRVAVVSGDLDTARLWDQQQGMYTAAFFQRKVAALAADAATVGAGVGILVLTARSESGIDTFSALADVVHELRRIDDVPVRYKEDTVVVLCPRTGLPHMRRLAERATRLLNGSAPGRETWVGAELVAAGEGEAAEAMTDRVLRMVESMVHRQSTRLESNLFAAQTGAAGEVLTRLLGDYDSALRVLSQPSLPLDAIIEQITAVLAFKDVETQEHSRRVVAYSLAIGRELGLPEADLEPLRVGAWLHDVGKIGVPDSILKKPGPLTPAEWDMMKQHVTIGVRMLAMTPVPGMALDVVRHHHERWDGTGYPTGLKGEEIPLLARIFAIADVYDAITSDRPYRKALAPEEARAQIAQASGSHLCPVCVAAFLRIEDLNAAVHEAVTHPT